MPKTKQTARAVRLTAEDWVEIYYALEYRLGFSPALQGGGAQSSRWRAHLRRIMKAIGLDGCDAASNYADSIEDLAELQAAARHVVDSWTSDNLADAVNNLEACLPDW